MAMPGPGVAMPGPGAAPTPPVGGGGAAPGMPAGGPPGGLGSLLGMLPGSVPTGGDPSQAMMIAMDGINKLAEAVKQNPQLIEVLGAVLKTHPMLRLLFLSASREPAKKAQAGAVAGTGQVPPILGR